MFLPLPNFHEVHIYNTWELTHSGSDSVKDTNLQRQKRGQRLSRDGPSKVFPVASQYPVLPEHVEVLTGSREI